MCVSVPQTPNYILLYAPKPVSTLKCCNSLCWSQVKSKWCPIHRCTCKKDAVPQTFSFTLLSRFWCCFLSPLLRLFKLPSPRCLQLTGSVYRQSSGAEFYSNLPRSAVCQGRQFSLTGGLTRSWVSRRMRGCGRWSLQVVTPSCSEIGVEESPAATVRRIWTSPGSFMRKRWILMRRQRSAGRHHAAKRKNALRVRYSQTDFSTCFTAFHVNRCNYYSNLRKWFKKHGHMLPGLGAEWFSGAEGEIFTWKCNSVCISVSLCVIIGIYILAAFCFQGFFSCVFV